MEHTLVLCNKIRYIILAKEYKNLINICEG